MRKVSCKICNKKLGLGPIILKILSCIYSTYILYAQNYNPITLPFNLHLDFWKWRSWEIKVLFKPQKNFRSCKPGFFFSLSPGFFSGLWYKSSFFLGGDLEKKSRFAGPEIFLRFEADLDFSRPWFSEIKVQIKKYVLCFRNSFVNTHFASCCITWFHLTCLTQNFGSHNLFPQNQKQR